MVELDADLSKPLNGTSFWWNVCTDGQIGRYLATVPGAWSALDRYANLWKSVKYEVLKSNNDWGSGTWRRVHMAYFGNMVNKERVIKIEYQNQKYEHTVGLSNTCIYWVPEGMSQWDTKICTTEITVPFMDCELVCDGEIKRLSMIPEGVDPTQLIEKLAILTYAPKIRQQHNNPHMPSVWTFLLCCQRKWFSQHLQRMVVSYVLI